MTSNIENIITTIAYTPMGMRHFANGESYEVWGCPGLFKGPPGCGKTAITEARSRAIGLTPITLIASIREPTDFCGLPLPNAKMDGVIYAPADWFRLACELRYVNIFLDEINSAAPATQAGLHRIIQEREVGGKPLPGEVRFMAAMNPTEIATGGYSMGIPLCNRFCHFEWPALDVDRWCDWLLTAGTNGHAPDPLNAAAEQARVLEEWPEAYAKAAALVTALLRAKRDIVYKMPDRNDPQSESAWPSNRTWEFATRLLASAEIQGNSESEKIELVAAAVGTGPAGELISFMKHADLPNPAELLDGTVKFKHNPRRLDVTIAVLSSCAALVAPAGSEKRKKRTAALWTLMTIIGEDALDVCVPAARALVQHKLTAFKEARQLLAKLQPVLAAAGVK